MKIVQFKNDEPKSPFAPVWNYFLGESKILDVDFKKLEKYLLEKESEILELPDYKDGYTGLKNSTTSRFNRYNVLNFDNEEIRKLKKNICSTHEKFLNRLELDLPPKLWIQCWYNVMKKGQHIDLHLHDWTNTAYLGGHICVKSENTYTGYISSVNQINEPEYYKSENETGKITLFQSCIPHFTNTYEGNEERITIAFDLFLEEKHENCERLY